MRLKSKMTAIVLVMFASCGLGCVGGSASSKANLEAIKQYILDEAPSDIPNKLDVVFEDKIKLLGYRITPEKKAKPGAEVRLTLYWECLEQTGEGWNLFTHIKNSNNEVIKNVDGTGPLRRWVDNKQLLSPGAWVKGKFYQDELVFDLPDKIDGGEAIIVVGIWKGNVRLRVTRGEVDDDSRAIVAKLTTGVVKPPAPQRGISMMAVDRLGKDDVITIDGRLDEPAWQKAASTGPLTDVRTGDLVKEFPVQGNARVTWNENFLYVAFEVQSTTVIGGFPSDAVDPHLWERDTIEIMIDPDGNGDNKDYYEIQINPQNLVFDSQFDDYNQPGDPNKGVFGHMEWSSKLQSQVVVDGEIDKPEGARGYTVEARIPWASFTKAKQIPPKQGDSWRMNFYAMKNNSGVAWSPILGQGNFHKASRFGRVVWLIPDAKASK